MLNYLAAKRFLMGKTQNKELVTESRGTTCGVAIDMNINYE